MTDEKACPFCAEIIRAGAIKCRFCGTMLVDDHGHPVASPGSPAATSRPAAAPSLFGALLGNLFCPGLGSWRMGERRRGLIIGIVVFVAGLLWLQEIVPLYTKLLREAANTGHVNIPAAREQLSGSVWYDVMLYGFVYSFIDVLYLSWLRGRKPVEPAA